MNDLKRLIHDRRERRANRRATQAYCPSCGKSKPLNEIESIRWIFDFGSKYAIAKCFECVETPPC